MSPEQIGILGIIVFVAFLALSIPIGISCATIGFFGLIAVKGLSPALGVLSSIPFHYSYEWVFVVIPMFLLMGHFSYHGGVGEDAYNAAQKWLGRIRGGLAMATTAACAGFGFASGSSLATAATFTRLSLPEMRRHNYDDSLSCGCIAASGTLAALIPPSGLMVIYTIFTEVSLGKLLIAGIFPGIMVAFLFCITLFLRLKLNPELAPMVAVKISLTEKILSLRWVGPLLIVIASLLGGIYFGVFTPTEAGAIGGLVTFIIFLLRRGFNLKMIMEVILDTIGTTAMIFLIIIGAMIFGRFLGVSGIIDAFGELMMGLPVHRLVVLALILFIYLVLGTFMEVVAILALTLPIFTPILEALQFNEIWVGVLIIMMGEIGVITPPLGTNVYVVKATAGEDVSLDQIFAGIFPFFLAYVAAVIIVVAVPSIALFLPGMMR